MAALKVPAGQSVHSRLPVPSAYVPGGQVSQPMLCDGEPVRLAALPAGHSVHVGEPAWSAYDPPGHSVHAELEVAPGVGCCVPMGHCAHASSIVCRCSKP